MTSCEEGDLSITSNNQHLIIPGQMAISLAKTRMTHGWDATRWIIIMYTVVVVVNFATKKQSKRPTHPIIISTVGALQSCASHYRQGWRDSKNTKSRQSNIHLMLWQKQSCLSGIDFRALDNA